MLDPALEELIDTTPAGEEVEVILRLRDPQKHPPGVRIICQFGDIATCRIHSDRIQDIRNHESISSMKASRYINWEPPVEDDNEELEESSFTLVENDGFRVPREFTGKNIVVAALDWGADFALDAFRRKDGKTRFLAIWDQSALLSPEKPNPYGYGIIYLRDDIDRALQEKDPYVSLGYHPSKCDPIGIGAHGTHVLDIAAGSRRLSPQGEVQGVAPDADLIFVHLGVSRTDGLSNLGDSVGLLEALDFVANLAKVEGDRPWVVNTSLGSMGGPHDGTTLVEKGMDNLLQAGSGRAICMSGGNYKQAKTHTHGRLRPGSKRELTWIIDPADTTPNELEVWYHGRDVFAVNIGIPDGTQTLSASLGEKVPILVNGQEVGRIYHRNKDPNNQDNHINIFLYTGAPAGLWKVTLYGKDIVNGNYHIWIERDRGNPRNQSRLDKADATINCTSGVICNGERTIAVEAFDSRTPDRSLAPFSSCGPTRDGRQKPDILAPGVRILAARSNPAGSCSQDSGLVEKSGASMAAPHVTGAVALIFEAAPRKLDISETQKILFGSAQKAPDNTDCFGDGYLDIDAALNAAQRIEENEKDLSSEQLNISVPEEDYNSSNNLVNGIFCSNSLLANNESSSPIETGIVEIHSVYDENESARDIGDESLDEEIERVKRRNFVLVSGGPGPYDNRDIQHDQSWANYVTPPLLMTDTSEKLKKFSEDDEDVWWLVYKPAYVRRWDEDLKNPKRKKAIKEVRDRGFNSYVDFIEARARSHKWNFRWFSDSKEFWKKLETFHNPISRLWYWGHAATDLWLSLRHGDAGLAISPQDNEIITLDQIRTNQHLRSHFQSGSQARIHRFVGCNTSDFAQEWAKTFKVWAQGTRGPVHFKSIYNTGGEPSLVQGAKTKLFSPAGNETDLSEILSPTLTSESDSNLLDVEEIDEFQEIVMPFESYNGLFEEETEFDDESHLADSLEGERYNDLEPTGSEIVNLAEEVLSVRKGFPSSALLEYVLSGLGTSNTLSSLGINSNSLISPAFIFDVFVFGKNPAMRCKLGNIFDVIALPQSRLRSELKPGDLLFRRALGTNFGHVSIIITPERVGYEHLSAKNLIPEINQLGEYVLVIEGGKRPHSLKDSFARRILDPFGQLPNNQLVLRIKQIPRQKEIKTEPLRYPKFKSNFFNEWSEEISRSDQDYIRWVQSALNNIIGLNLNVDGIMGPQTSSAIRGFQQKNGLVVDGVAGPKTESALRAALGNSPIPRSKSEGLEEIWILENFDFAKSDLRPEHYADIQAIVDKIKTSQNTSKPIHSIEIMGHTDPKGSGTNNYQLGCHRAWAATKELKKRLDSSLLKKLYNNIRVASLGEKQPIKGNDAASRRVEISLYSKKLPELPAGSINCNLKPKPGSKKGHLLVRVIRSDINPPFSNAVRGASVNVGWNPEAGNSVSYSYGDTDENGYKDIGLLDARNYIVNISSDLAGEKTKEVTIKAGGKHTVIFNLYRNTPPPPKGSCSVYDEVDWDDMFVRIFNHVCGCLQAAKAFCNIGSGLGGNLAAKIYEALGGKSPLSQLIIQYIGGKDLLPKICTLSNSELESLVDEYVIRQSLAEVTAITGIVGGPDTDNPCNPITFVTLRYRQWKKGQKCYK